MQAPLTITRREIFDFLSAEADRNDAKVSRKCVACATKLVSYFLRWRDWKAANHRTQWVYQKLSQIQCDAIEYGMYSIRRAIEFLEYLGILERRRNPDNGQDRVYQYRIEFELPKSETEAGNAEIKSPKFEIKSPKCEIKTHHSRSSIESDIEIEDTTTVVVVDEIFVENVPPQVDRFFKTEISPPDCRGTAELNTELTVEPPVSDEDTFSEPVRGAAELPKIPANKGVSQSLRAAELLLERIEDLGVRVTPSIENLVKNSPQKTVEGAIELVRTKRRKGELIDNPAGLLVAAIRGGWQVEAAEKSVPDEFAAWFTAARSAGVVCGSERDRDTGEMLVYVEVDRFNVKAVPWREVQSVYPLDCLF